HAMVAAVLRLSMIVIVADFSLAPDNPSSRRCLCGRYRDCLRRQKYIPGRHLQAPNATIRVSSTPQVCCHHGRVPYIENQSLILNRCRRGTGPCGHWGGCEGLSQLSIAAIGTS